MRETLVVISLAVALRDSDTAARTLYRLGQTDTRVSIAQLKDDLAALFQSYLGRRIEDVDSTLLLQELLTLALKHKIRVPPEYTLLGRASATIEGIVRQFDPDLDIAKIATPYAERLLIERVGPDNLQGGLYRALLQFQGLSQDVPLQVAQILNDLAGGNLSVNLRGAAVERLTETLLVATAAISGSILGAAFIVGSLIALSRMGWSVLGVPLVALLAGALGLTIFSWVVAYVVFRPRLRKLRLSGILGKRRRR
jgi:ubiquinone biosynthesis protein